VKQKVVKIVDLLKTNVYPVIILIRRRKSMRKINKCENNKNPAEVTGK